ncbi:threonine--tRNA ligase [Clostridium sp. CAG:354]|jgi:threonyl-tRNA synthetase|nr:threonine--tRNA ligase [Clostridium sp.]MBS5864398.1 threonine--tRNA ligase [Clostridium sp.]MEE0269013.1 threonine--tRNA ligase [Clostridia bacterium]CDE11366.1 threonine--tRNA ligase [Clostridium sp. CAG:354]
MVKLKLKDGSIMEVEKGSSILDVAKKISEGLARVATCGEINGKVEDLRHEINEDCELVIHTFQDDDLEGKKAYWHTTSHIMAQAIKRLYGDVKLTIGPAIENGFYYDFDTEKHFSEEDFEKIEEEMKKIIKEDLPIERYSLSREEAIKFMKENDEPYKVELIEELPEGEEISFYKQGEFVDLCAGPHLMSTGKVKVVKLLSASGAYWRGNENNKMLQRVYGISFPKKSQLEDYLNLLQEAKERDHRKIGKELDLFMTHELVGSGLPMYLPDGATIRRILERYIQDKEIELGYKHVYTPSLANVELYKTSGHWDHYKEDMFPVMKMDNEEMVLRPMNCPHHMLIYKNKLHSYRDLPIRIGELAHDFRYEASGSVCGLERVREMCQNDAHLFVTPEQIQSEISEVVKLILAVYEDFGFENYSFRLSLRDKNDKHKYFDDDEMWESAESQLRDTLKALNLDFYEAEGEAAFYGPKLDVQIKSALGHDVTISTCQLDFLLPERFKLTYIGEDGKEHRPVVIHRAILGSSDRFMAFLIEETKGALPLWLAPTQAKILPIADAQVEYAKKIEKEYKKAGIRIEVDDRNEKIGYKIREAQLQKIPYMLVVGDKEIEANAVAVRSRKEGDLGQVNKEEFLERMKEEINNKVR